MPPVPKPQPAASPVHLLPPEEIGQPTEPGAWSHRTKVGGVILESIFGKPDPNAWRPLLLSTFFSEGWLEPWVPSPSGSGGAPRQGWINAADGNLYRVGLFTFGYGDNRAPKGDDYLGSFTLCTPFSRRLLLITNIPFVIHNAAVSGLPIEEPDENTGRASRNQTGFGDISFTPRVLLHETRDFSLTAELSVLTPTGNSGVAGKPALTPAVQFWDNFADRWEVRGGLGILVPTQRGADTELISQLAIGQTLTDHDVPLIGDFTYYLSTVVNTPTSNGDLTRVALTPGIRSHLGHNWFLLAGLQVPVTKERTTDLGFIFRLMKAW
jgi:hypothetical protein